MRSVAKYVLLVALIVGVGTWTVTRGQTGNGPGALDTSFGTGGVATVPTLTGVFDHIAVQKLNNEDRVVALKAQTEWAITRLLDNGASDPTFGTGGIVQRTSRFGSVYAWGGIVAQSDNKLVVVGTVPTSKNTTAIAVSRYMPNGQFDTSFGDGGTTFLARLTNFNIAGGNTVLQSDGKIVVTGSRAEGDGTYSTQVIRLETSGALDTSFGSGGVATLAGAGIPSSPALQLVQNPDGVLEERLVVATAVPHGSLPTQTWSASLLRLTPGGSLDATFGDSGVATIPVPEAQMPSLNHLAVDSSNRIVAVGSYRPGGASTDRHILAVRYLGDGTPDTDFAVGGMLVQDGLVGDHQLVRVAVHQNGTILAVGCKGSSGNFAVLTWRFVDSGAPDSSFGVDGMATTQMRVGSWGGLAFVRGSSRFVIGGGAWVGAKGRLKLVPALGRFLY
jgi:uncharacterized delta-60 repeat protein